MRALLLFLLLELVPVSAMVPMMVPVLPCNMPGRTLWQNAGATSSLTLSGSSVAQWNDLSGHGNNFAQATGSSQPTYNATGFNGHPTIVFTSSQNLSTASTNASQPFAVSFVVQGVNWQSIGDWFFFQWPGGFIYHEYEGEGGGGGNLMKFHAGLGYPGTNIHTDNNPHFYTFYLANSTSPSKATVLEDGINISAYDAAPGTNGLSGALTIGNAPMNISEVYVTAIPSASQYAQLHYYEQRTLGTP